MRVRNSLFALAGASLLLTGCRLGLNPFPKPMHPGGSSSIGLNPFPSPKGGRHVPLASPPRDSTLEMAEGEWGEAPEVDAPRK